MISPFGQLKRWSPLIVGLAIAGVTMYFAVPGPLDGDAGELEYAPLVFAVPRPTGFPLYLLLGWLWSQFPLGPPAIRLNLFSGFLAGVTVLLLFSAASRLSRSWLAGAVAVGLLASLPGFWRYSTQASTYLLLTSLATAALWLALAWQQNRDWQAVNPSRDGHGAGPGRKPVRSERRTESGERPAVETAPGGLRPIVRLRGRETETPSPNRDREGAGREREVARSEANLLGGQLSLANARGSDSSPRADHVSRFTFHSSLFTLHSSLFTLPASWLCVGLAIAVHPLGVFAATVPAVVMLSRVRDLLRGWRSRRFLLAPLAGLLPLALYLLIPMRASWLAAELGSLDAAIRFGLVSPFFEAGPAAYLTGRGLQRGILPDPGSSAGWMVTTLVDRLGPLVVMTAAGWIGLLLRRRIALLALTVMVLSASGYVATFRQRLEESGQVANNVEGYLLVPFLGIALGTALGLGQLVAALWATRPRFAAVTSLIALFAALMGLTSGMREGLSQVTEDRSRSSLIASAWRDTFLQPIEPGAALAASWGDLTPLWYFQHAERLRTDLAGLFPPRTGVLQRWLSESTAPAYLVAPLDEPDRESLRRFRFAPWGPLVRVTPADRNDPLPPSLAPLLLQVGDDLTLLGYRLIPVHGRSGLLVGWRSLRPVSNSLAVSVRIRSGSHVEQRDALLVSQWFPWDFVDPEISALSWVPDLPAGAAAAEIDLVFYDSDGGRVLRTASGGEIVTIRP